MTRILLLFTSLPFLFGSLFSQTLLFRGLILDGSGAPVPGATVEVRPRNGGAPVRTESDFAGNFQIAAPSAGSVELAVQRAGFAQWKKTLQAGDLNTVYEVRLEPATLSQEIVVSATSIAATPEVIARTPGSVDVVDAAMLRDSRVFGFEEALRKVSGVYARPEEGFSLRPNISIRGLNPTRSARVLLLEDGVPLAYAPYGDNASYYHPPVDRFETIEVVKGSGQIAYGPMTVGGVVNYVTPAVPDRPAGTVSLMGATATT